MSRLTRNFKLSEFTYSETAIRHGLDNGLPAEYIPRAINMARWLQTFRDRLCLTYGKDMPIVISSGFRAPKVNKKVGGVKNSDHTKMLAVDFHVVGLTVAQTQRDIMELMQDCPYDQCIDEFSGWIHLALAEDGELPRMENLLARKRVGRFGKVKTEYLPY